MPLRDVRAGRWDVVDRALALQDAAKGTPRSVRIGGAVTGHTIAPLTEPSGDQWHLLADLLNDPQLTAPPVAVAAPIAYAGRLTLLVGREKKGGKSTTAGAALAQASKRGVRCLIVSLDEPVSDTVQRLGRFGANGDHIQITSRRPKDLAAKVKESGAQIVMIDSLALFVAGNVKDSGDSFQWTSALAPLQALARSENVAVVILAHANKASGTYRDSTAIGAAVDLILTLTQQQDGSRKAKAEGRFPVPDFTARMDSETGQIAFSLKDDGEPCHEHTPVTVELQRRVLRLLQSAEPEGLRSFAWLSLAKEEGISRPSYFRARKALHDAGRATHASSIYRVSPSGGRWLEAGVTEQ